MTPERFRLINALADEALPLTGSERAAFLDQACSGDVELRRYVERMLAAHQSSEGFLEIPALHLFSRQLANREEIDLTGREIARYQVLSRLGSGGHGDVWLARDTQLGREAALKFLQPEFSGNSGLAQRFAYEARCSSALNHPNIVTIYEIGQAEGLDFIAQEFVHGETLREKLAAGALDPQDALGIVVQAAAALEAAHTAGLVHRDIKPENIMLRPDGLVKVVDFGLARFVAAPNDAARPVTKPGAVMGTVKYMSPEQARGLDVDARSDIFSLGVVFYELITGTPPFSGATDADILAAILTSHPAPPSRVRSGPPREFDRVVLRCLEKDRENRYQSAGALRQDLNRLSRLYETKVSPRRLALIAVASAIILAIAGYSLYRNDLARRAPAPFNSMNIGSLALSGAISDATVSPDGAQVAFVRDEGGGQSLWLRRLTVPGDIRIVEPTLGVYFGLTFSPDGKSLYYLHRVARGTEELFRLPIKGPPGVRIAGNGIICAAPSRDGKQLAFIRLDTKSFETLLVIANSDGSASRTIATLRRPQYLGHDGLAWSPDDRFIVCFGGDATYYTPEAYRLLEFRVSDGAQKALTGGSWAFTGSLLWTADGHNLIFAASTREDGALQIWMTSYPDGGLRRITNDLSNYSRLSVTNDSRSLVALRTEMSAELFVTRPGDPARVTQISSGNIHGWNAVAWTPSRKIVFSADAGDFRNLWMIDADGRNLKQLTEGPDDKDEVETTRDGKYLLYQSQGKIWRANADGSGQRQLTHGALDVHPTSSADSRWVVYTTFPTWSPGIGGHPRLSKLSIDGGDPIELTREGVSMAQVSPDGKQIAGTWYGENDPRFTHSRLALLPFTGGPEIRLFERKPGDSAIGWSADGKALDYVVTVNGIGNLWRQPVAGGSPVPVTRFDTDELFVVASSLNSGQFALVRGKSYSDVVAIKKFL